MKDYKYYIINCLTISRIIGIPFMFLFDNKYWLFLYVIILFSTDYLDGYLARKFKCETVFGSIMDLIADKTIVIVILTLGLYNNNINVILYSLIVFRESISIIIRINEFRKSQKLIAANIVGKSKTALQFLGLSLMILDIRGYEIILWVMVLFSYYSLGQYLNIYIKGDKNE